MLILWFDLQMAKLYWLWQNNRNSFVTKIKVEQASDIKANVFSTVYYIYICITASSSYWIMMNGSCKKKNLQTVKPIASVHWAKYTFPKKNLSFDFDSPHLIFQLVFCTQMVLKIRVVNKVKSHI